VAERPHAGDRSFRHRLCYLLPTPNQSRALLPGRPGSRCWLSRPRRPPTRPTGRGHAAVGNLDAARRLRPRCRLAPGRPSRHDRPLAGRPDGPTRHRLNRAVALSSDRLGRIQGSCYLALGDSAKAGSILERTARRHQGRHKSKVIVLGNLALAHVHQRDIEQATMVLHRAIDLLEVSRSGAASTWFLPQSATFAPGATSRLCRT
jgi:hypothetical protein